MINVARRIQPALLFTSRRNISNWKMPAFELDSAGITGYFESRTETYMTFSQKLAQIKPMSLYHGFDEWTRQLLVTLSMDLGCGFATSIIIATCLIKTMFLYPTLKAQVMGLRHQEIKSLQQTYQEKMRIAQMSKNQALFKQANYDYKMGMKRKGISYAINLVNLLQIPILFSWFFSLRYMSNLPEVYPQMLTEGYLWFTDLSTYDPYFVLPVIAACASSLSIARSPNLARNNVMLPMLSQYTKYLKYLPFASLAFTGFFPASINLYWTTLALYQLMITQLMRTDAVVRSLGKRKSENPFKNIKYDEAIFVEEKQNSQQVMKAAATKQQQQNKIQEPEKPVKKVQSAKVNEVKVSLKQVKKKKENS